MPSKKNKKILFASHVGNPGGAEYALVSLCKRTDGANVLLFENGPLVDLLYSNNIPVDICKIPHKVKNIKREDGFLRIILTVPAALKMIVNASAHCKKYDVLVPMSQKAFVIFSFSNVFSKKTLIWYMNDLITGDNFSPFLVKAMVKLSRFSADHVVLNSKASLESWLSFGGDKRKASVSYSGIDTVAFDAIKSTNRRSLKGEFFSDDKPLIGMIGRISSWKGQHVFLEALSKLDGVNSLIVGDALFGEEEYYKKIKKYVQDNDMGKRVVFSGHREDIPNILSACDVIVHCSTSPEPFGRVIVEAMLSGTPVIASNEGGPKEIIQHGKTGYLSEPGNADELRTAIQSLLDNPKEAEVVASNARFYALEHFSSDAMVNSFRKLVSEIG